MDPSLHVYGSSDRVLDALHGRTVFVVVAGSTMTSTIPGISIAGPSPSATLYTPTLDAEYLVAGRPRTLNVIPVAPNGVPTPAIITRSIVEAFRLPVVVVDAGCFYPPLIASYRLPSAATGSRIDLAPALAPGTAERVFREAAELGKTLGRGYDAVVVAETIPGGTTTAAAVLETLGYPGIEFVSSSMPNNPKRLKRSVVSKALKRLGDKRNVFRVIDVVGDSVHPAVAGVAAGAASEGATVYLAGGTQMATVLAIIRSLGGPRPAAVLTTPWILQDRGSSLTALVDRVWPGMPIVAARVSFRDAPYEGLRLYEAGYAKEGVGAGAAMVYAVVNGLTPEAVARLVYDEYSRLVSKA